MQNWNVASITPSADPTLQLESPTMTQNLQHSSLVPMGFAAQMRALATVQEEQAKQLQGLQGLQEKLQALEKEAELKDKQIENLGMEAVTNNDKVKRLEHAGAMRAAHLTDAVAHLQRLNFFHDKARLAFRQRCANLQPDDFEGYMTAFAATLSIIVNDEQQSSFGAGRSMNGQLPTTTAGPIGMSSYSGQAQPGVVHPMYYHGGIKYYPAPMGLDWQLYCAPHKHHHPCQMCREQGLYGPSNVPPYCGPHNHPQPCQQCRGW